MSLRLGFVGTGAIATAIATGLCSGKEAPTLKSVTVSPRSAANAAKLSAMFPTLVTVATDNQAVLDASDIVFLCVLPPQLPAVLAELKFRPEQTLVSLATTSKLPQLAELSGLAPERVFKMICLPPVAAQQGICLLIPKDKSPLLRTLFDSLGGTVECESEAIMQAMMIPTCTMGPFFALLQTQQEWLVKSGVSAEDASFFLGRTYLGLAQAAEKKCQDPKHFAHLVADNTPGGINEQSIRNLKTMGFYNAYNTAMNGILERIRGQGSGERTAIEE